MRYLVTGSAGFIGFHLSRRLIADGHEVVGVDSLNAYYDVALKERRHAMLLETGAFSAHIVDVADFAAMQAVFETAAPDVVIHLAAQAGVRHALEHPEDYVSANIVGSFNVIELSKRHGVRHLLMASTSSAYGANTKMPFQENDKADFPLTIYAASKKSSELIAHCYAHLWNLPITMFRFFTVYGPWGRPDMALYKFVDAILKDRPIDIYNHGDMERDFTFVSDLVEGIVRLVDAVPERGRPVADFDSLSPVAPWRLVNIGNGNPVRLLDFISEIERCLGRPAIRNYLGMHPGDVPRTFADSDLLEALTGYRPSTPVSQGVEAFVAWFRDYYRV